MLTKEEKKNKEGYCKYGCGKIVNNKYIVGHARRGKKNSDYQKRVISVLQSGDNNVSKRPEVKEKMRLAKLGKKLSEETKRKMSISNSGENNGFYSKKHSEESLKKMSESLKGRKWNENQYKIMKQFMSGDNNPAKRPEVRKKIGEKSLGRILSHFTRLIMSVKAKKRLENPENHPMWLGGISKDDYCDAWNDKEYKKDILSRDNYQCQNPDCWENYKVLHRHHIDYNKKNCEPNNLITLCCSCNSRANANRDYWQTKYSELVNHA